MNSQLIGAAGVFHVAAELSMRGMVALPSIRNVKGADILVADPKGRRFAFIQVKTSKAKATFWPISEHAGEWAGPDCYYAFVRRVEDRFEVFLEKAEVVARESEAGDRAAAERGCKKWAPCWAIKGQGVNEGVEDRARKQWREFNLS